MNMTTATTTPANGYFNTGHALTHNQHLTRLEGLRNMACVVTATAEASEPLSTGGQNNRQTSSVMSDKIHQAWSALGGFFVSVIQGRAFMHWPLCTPTFSLCREGEEYKTRKGNNSACPCRQVLNLLTPKAIRSFGITENENLQETHTMSNSSLHGLQMVESFSIQINLPNSAFIERFNALHDGCGWLVSITTTKQQTALINGFDGRPKHFSTLDEVALFLARKGAVNLTVSLTGLAKEAA